ncbi:hypothetical protein NIES2104_56210 [Leptolyngbya sp. NIES-2104]|nr:hypothetical protein NIES2104_56210 [Leptolyngbya sp. NIES-2104]
MLFQNNTLHRSFAIGLVGNFSRGLGSIILVACTDPLRSD